MRVQTAERSLEALVDRHRRLYDGPDIDEKLEAIIRESASSKLSSWDIHRILRTSRSVFFDTHVEMVSGHHTATYLRFASIARMPALIRPSLYQSRFRMCRSPSSMAMSESPNCGWKNRSS